MPTIQDTIYPRFKASISDADLDCVYTPTPQECALAAQTTKGKTAYLGFLILLKTFQRLGYFVYLADIPDPIITHIAQAVDHHSFIDQLSTYDRSGSRKRHQTTIRAYQGVKPFRDGSAAVIQQAVAEAAIHTEQLDDLINRAIEELIHQYYELPGFTTLIKEAQKQRTKTYTLLYQQVVAALTPARQAGLDSLFTVDPITQRSLWDTLKDTPGKPTLTNLKAIADRLTWFETYQAATAAVIDFPEAKRSHFATEAMAYDTTAMNDIKAPRRYTLACVLLATQYAQTLDDLTETFIKRIRSIHHDAKEALQKHQEQHQARTDKLITALRDLVVGYQQEGTAEHRFAAMEGVLQGRSTDLLQDCDAHLTYAGSNFAPFVWNAYKSHRATVFRLFKLLPFRPGGSDPKLGQAIAFLLRHERTKSPWISLKVTTSEPDSLANDMPTLDLSWIPVGW